MSSSDIEPLPAPARSPQWTRIVCLVLLSATFLNYANRFTFTQNALPIQEAFDMDEEGYGEVAGWFGLGFACGGLTFGILADVVSVRILYPLVLLAWSIAGISSGTVETLTELKIARFLLGMFEAGHWPCALRTTQRVFLPEQRTWGNSLLQSGASLGAVATPLLVVFLLRWPDQWRLAFFIIGGLGLPWVFWWLKTIKESDVRRPVIQTDEAGGTGTPLQEIPFWMVFTTRRWWILLFVVVCINTFWHYIRVWMPLTLEKDHGYSHEFVQYFTSAYYLATFFGALAAGWLTIRLGKKGGNVHRARMTTFLIFALLSTLAIPAAFMSGGPLLLAALLVVAFGSLGLFPIYYSLNQEISAKNQGKVGGSLGFSTWSILFFVHPAVGRAVVANPDIRPWLFAGVGLGPLLAFAALVLFWGRRPTVEND
jgi:ACS family hexuronate transporter-like MFS transporter